LNNTALVKCKYRVLSTLQTLLTPPQPSVTHTFAHIINQTPPLLGWRNGPAIKRPQRMGPE